MLNRSVFAEPLQVRVATVAQANQVGQRVCFLISLDSEKPERANVVNVERAAQTRLGDSAELANVLISPASVPLLTFPVRSVVKRMPALPHRISVARPVLRFPHTKAGRVAKRHLAVIPGPARAGDGLSTGTAWAALCALPTRGVFSNHSPDISTRHAFSGAVGMRPALQSVRRASIKDPPTSVALNITRRAKAYSLARCPIARLYSFPVGPLVGPAFLSSSVRHVPILPSNGVLARIDSEGYS